MAAMVSTMGASNASCFTTYSISLKASTKPSCLSLKPVSIISSHGFHAAHSCFLGKVPRQHMWPEVTPSAGASIEAAGKVKRAVLVSSKLVEPEVSQDSVAFLKNPETSAEEKKPVKDSITLRHKRVVRQERNPKRLNSYSAQRIVLDNYEILKYPLRTEAAVKNISSNNTLVFVVDKRADKKCIRNAAKELFNIQTRKINTSIAPDGTKKAFLMVVPEQNASELAKKLKIF
ncbi:ribosomal protein [Lithospermum erythrorhizon]|uniref:Ribosomal protein n=1 Tax=Lithospermum erythrorhizon TaxID=34254 RepID=A0AAV3Q5G8_LITER